MRGEGRPVEMPPLRFSVTTRLSLSFGSRDASYERADACERGAARVRGTQAHRHREEERERCDQMPVVGRPGLRDDDPSELPQPKEG